MTTPESARYHAMILPCKYIHSNQSIPASKHCYHSYHKHDQTSLNSLQDLMEAIFEMVSSLQQGTQLRGDNTRDTAKLFCMKPKPMSTLVLCLLSGCSCLLLRRLASLGNQFLKLYPILLSWPQDVEQATPPSDCSSLLQVLSFPPDIFFFFI